MIFLILYFVLLFLSIFTASWRLSIGALGLQAVGMGGYLISVKESLDFQDVVMLSELLFVKGIIIPWLLVRRFNHAGVPRFIDLIPANLLHWTIATFIVASAYVAASEFARHDTAVVMLIGTAFSAVALGMLALSSRNEVPGQLISLLTIENGVNLFTIGGNHATPWALEVFVGFDFFVMVVLASSFLQVSKGTSVTTTDLGDIL